MQPKISESLRSSMPPWPGIRLPESLTPTPRLMRDSMKVADNAKMDTTTYTAVHRAAQLIEMHCPQNEPDENRAQDAAEKSPPSSFWEKCEEPSYCLPIRLPAMWANGQDPENAQTPTKLRHRQNRSTASRNKYDGQQHKAGVDRTHDVCFIGMWVRDEQNAANALPQASEQKAGHSTTRVAQRRAEEHGGSDTQAPLYLAVELRHAEKLKAAQAAHDGAKMAVEQYPKPGENKYNGVDDTCNGTGNKAGQPRSHRPHQHRGWRLGSRRRGTIGLISLLVLLSPQTYGRMT